MNKSAIIAIFLLTLGIVSGIGIGVYKLSNNQNTQNLVSSAKTKENDLASSTVPSIITDVSAQACNTPSKVESVEVNYPSCVGEKCSFVEADCVWDSVDEAAKYTVKITEVESSSVVKNITTQGTATSYTFPVTQKKTYRCEVSAVNACGTAGPPGEGEALCEVDGLTVSIQPSPTPTPTPTPTPKPSPLACGTSCSSTTDCQTGLVCLKLANGTGYCANPAYQQACSEKPSVNTCCKAPPKPTPPPELPKSGLLDDTIIISAIGVVFIGIAALMVLL